MQAKADALLGEQVGAVVVLNAQSGEILALASHPDFDPNEIASNGDVLLADPASPLINRSAQGLYPAESVLDFLLAASFEEPATISEDDATARLSDFGFYSSPALSLPVALAATPGGDRKSVV